MAQARANSDFKTLDDTTTLGLDSRSVDLLSLVVRAILEDVGGNRDVKRAASATFVLWECIT